MNEIKGYRVTVIEIHDADPTPAWEQLRVALIVWKLQVRRMRGLARA